MLSTMLASAGSSGSLLSSAAPSLLILLKNGPHAAAPLITSVRRGVSHLASSSDKGSSGPQPGDKASAVQQIKRAFIPRGTAASHLRSFAAQPALAEDNPMFCVSWLLLLQAHKVFTIATQLQYPSTNHCCCTIGRFKQSRQSKVPDSTWSLLYRNCSCLWKLLLLPPPTYFILTLLRVVFLAPVVRSLQFQCEQTNENKGCTTVGVCGKTATVAGLQDLLIYSLKGLGSWAHLANQVITCKCHMQQSRWSACMHACVCCLLPCMKRCALVNCLG